MEIQLHQVNFAPYKMQIPPICPQCKADLTVPEAILIWDWAASLWTVGVGDELGYPLNHVDHENTFAEYAICKACRYEFSRALSSEKYSMQGLPEVLKDWAVSSVHYPQWIQFRHATSNLTVRVDTDNVQALNGQALNLSNDELLGMVQLYRDLATKEPA